MYNFQEFKNTLQKIIDHTINELSTLRTGKASVTILDPVRVQVYGTSMAVGELANISTPDTNMIIIDPWDKNILEDIEKAINKAGLNLNPIVDKQIIRIIIPPLTEERRKEMVKQLHQKLESSKVMMRTARADTKNEIEDQEGQSGVSEDDIHRDLEEMEKIMDQYEAQIQELSDNKEKELMSI